MRKQTTSKLLMVRPQSFGFNEETAGNNAFQQKGDNYDPEKVKQLAVNEFDHFVSILQEHGIEVLVVNDTEYPPKSDAVFPNNWFSTHQEGVLVVYPMFSENRRLEVREDIIDDLAENYGYNEVIDWTPALLKNIYLEGTGSLILDRVNKIAYACYSERTNEELLKNWGRRMGYKTIGFHSVDKNGMNIYHTNVMMAMGDHFVVISMESIQDPNERELLLSTFQKTGKTLIDLSLDQIDEFAGNMLQVENADEKSFLIMSKAAFDSLNPDQIELIKEFTEPLVAPIPTIEKYGGGSVRCMLAEVFLPVSE